MVENNDKLNEMRRAHVQLFRSGHRHRQMSSVNIIIILCPCILVNKTTITSEYESVLFCFIC